MVKFRVWTVLFFIAVCKQDVLGEHDSNTDSSDSDYDENSGDDVLWPADYSYISACDNILLLQTIDGRLHAVNRDNGEAMWGELQLSKDWFPQVTQRKTIIHPP